MLQFPLRAIQSKMFFHRFHHSKLHFSHPLQVRVLDKFGTYQKLKCLKDSDCMSSFITQKCARRLHLGTTDLTINLDGLGSMQTLSKHGGVTPSIRPRFRQGPNLLTDAIELRRICEQLLTTSLLPGRWSHIPNLDSADPDFHIPVTIDLSLGADVFLRILLDGRISGEYGEPDALNTVFGYILTGRINNPSRPTITSLFCVAEESSLENTMKRFFEVEQVPETRIVFPEEEIFEKLFSDTVTRTPCGRFVICLPFKDSFPSFPDSRS
ncbi:hypothetical protein JTB14_024436 [Gonioctena quinquepunctata]|nr:hypothetical protein JTB14_024436 [Gonioctena quinquepunctata]